MVLEETVDYSLLVHPIMVVWNSLEAGRSTQRVKSFLKEEQGGEKDVSLIDQCRVVRVVGLFVAYSCLSVAEVEGDLLGKRDHCRLLLRSRFQLHRAAFELLGEELRFADEEISEVS